MSKRLVIVQNRPTQFDMPLYALMSQSAEWDLLVIYSDFDRTKADDAELGRAPVWDHVPAENDIGAYLEPEESKKIGPLVQRIVEFSPQLVILCGYFPPLHARLVGPLKRHGIKIGLRSDNTLPHSNFSGWRGWAKKLLLPFWLCRYDTWHPVGSLAAEYLESMSLRSKPVFKFPYAVDVDWFEQQSNAVRLKRKEVRAEFGLSPGHFVILGIMKWHPREDPITLLSAFHQLLAKHENCRLILIGDGPLAPEVTMASKDIGPAVLLPGYQSYSELPKFYAISDVFVHPSVDEPWGVSVQEALACGVPAIVAEGVGSRIDLMKEELSRWCFPNADVDKLGALLMEQRSRKPQLGNLQELAKHHARLMDYSYSLVQFSNAIEEVSH